MDNLLVIYSSLLQCIDCYAGLSVEHESLFKCESCTRLYPIEHGILKAQGSLCGNNQVAASFYNGPWWQRYRRRERFAFLFFGGESRVRRRLLGALPELRGARLLDVGIGDGSNLPHISLDCEVFGIDISLTQLEKCLLQPTANRVHVALAEAEHLPFQARSFDHAISIGAFNLFNDRRASVQEIVRVVKPGGTVVIADEVPSLVNLLPGRRMGLRRLDGWLLARAVGLGEDFATLLYEKRGVDVVCDARDLLLNVQLGYLCAGTCYCLVGQVPRGK